MRLLKLKHTALLALAIFLGLSAIVGAQQMIGAYARYRRQTTTPATPPPGFVWTYFRDSDGHMMSIDESAATHDFNAVVGGTVSTISGPAEMTIANPTTTPAITWTSQAANKFLASPLGSSGAMSARVMGGADVSTFSPLLTDWIVTPVAEANAIPVITFTGIAQLPGGVAFMCTRACTVTGARLAYPNATSKSIKVSLWNNAGTRLQNITTVYNSAGIKTVTFGSSTSLTPYKKYHLSLYETGGTTSIGYSSATSSFPFSTGNTNVDVLLVGSPVIVWLAWGEDAGGGAGDVFPGNQGSGAEIYPVDPIITVP